MNKILTVLCIATIALSNIANTQIDMLGFTYYEEIPLDKELQEHIEDVCRERHICYELVLAVIEKESNFKIDAVGDNGNSLGLMQIQPKWNWERMKRLNCTNLLDPYQNVEVGIDILAEYFHEYDDVYTVLMAYNGGRNYAEKMAAKGIYSEYALKVSARAAALEGVN